MPAIAPKARYMSGSFLIFKLTIKSIISSKNPFVSKNEKPLKSFFKIIESQKSLKTTQASIAALAGRRAYIIEFNTGLSLTFLSAFEIIKIIKSEA